MRSFLRTSLVALVLVSGCAQRPTRVVVSPTTEPGAVQAHSTPEGLRRVVAARPPGSVPTTTTTTVDEAAVWRFVAAAHPAHAPQIRPSGSRRAATPTSSALSASLEPCGGTDYPPCYVAQRESHGDYRAFNPNGCGGHACFGKWQFSGAWAGKLGLPLELATATSAQQDAAARALWAGGRGCSNWAAC